LNGILFIPHNVVGKFVEKNDAVLGVHQCDFWARDVDEVVDEVRHGSDRNSFQLGRDMECIGNLERGESNRCPNVTSCSTLN
tara:strand:- start:3057 stop:3302 length:246 start_codon:yes stop_codon:yes gene_type:complete